MDTDDDKKKNQLLKNWSSSALLGNLHVDREDQREGYCWLYDTLPLYYHKVVPSCVI